MLYDVSYNPVMYNVSIGYTMQLCVKPGVASLVLSVLIHYTSYGYHGFAKYVKFDMCMLCAYRVCMNCIIEGCIGVGRHEEKGLCFKCASYKRFRLRAWRLEKGKEREMHRKREVSVRVVETAEARRVRREAINKTRRVESIRPARRFGQAKSLAKRRGLSWTVPQELYESLIACSCHYCGGSLPSTGVGLDRKENRQGYEPENVVPCCTRCNVVKGANLSYPEMVIAMRAILSLVE